MLTQHWLGGQSATPPILCLTWVSFNQQWASWHTQPLVIGKCHQTTILSIQYSLFTWWTDRWCILMSSIFFLFALSMRARFAFANKWITSRGKTYTGERVIRENTLVVVLASSRQIRPRVYTCICMCMYMHTSLYIILKNLHSIRRRRLKCLCR